MKRKGEGRERRAETPNCFALQEIITGAVRVRVCPRGFGVCGSGSSTCCDCVHIIAHLLALTGTEIGRSTGRAGESRGAPRARELREGMSPPSRALGKVGVLSISGRWLVATVAARAVRRPPSPQPQISCLHFDICGAQKHRSQGDSLGI